MKKLYIILLTIFLSIGAANAQNPIKMTIRDHTIPVGSVVNVGVEFVTTLDETTDEVKYSISFDPSRLTFLLADIGPAFEIWTKTPPLLTHSVDTSQVSLGFVGITTRVPPNFAGLFREYNHYITNIRFLAISATPNTPIRFADFPTTRANSELISGMSVTQGTDYIDGQVTIVDDGSARKVRIPDALYDNLLLATVPIELEAKGNENAIGFTLVYDTTRWGYRFAYLGQDAQGAELNVNTNSAGSVGIALALQPGQTFPQGLRKVVNLVFQVFERDGPSTFFFSDFPVPRGLVSAVAEHLPLYFESPTIAFQQGYEGDVSPRSTGDRNLSLSDWVQMGRYATGVDVDENTFGEFQRADCAPKETKGDGRLTLNDWVQAGRYAAGLDQPQFIGGPYLEQSMATTKAPLASIRSARSIVEILGLSRPPERIPDQARRVLLSPAPRKDGEPQYLVTLNGRGDENAVAFTLEFNPNELEFSGSAPYSRATLHINRSEPGRIGVVTALPPGETFDTEGGIVVLLFSRKSANNVPSIQFVDGAVKGEVVTVNADAVPAVFGTEARVIKRR